MSSLLYYWRHQVYTQHPVKEPPNIKVIPVSVRTKRMKKKEECNELEPLKIFGTSQIESGKTVDSKLLRLILQ